MIQFITHTSIHHLHHLKLTQVEGPVTTIIAGGELKAKGFAPGTYQLKSEVQVQDDVQNMVHWFEGKYAFHTVACEGECGSKHPHSRILASSKANFTVVN